MICSSVIINPRAHGLNRIGLEFIGPAFGRAEEPRKPSPIQGSVRRSTSTGWDRGGSRSWMPGSVFRANLDDGGARLFARRFRGSFRAAQTAGALFRSSKSQAPSSRETPSTKPQTPIHDSALELGIWNFFGAWSLGFGAFAAIGRVNVRPSPYTLRSADPRPAPIPSGA